MYKNVKLTGILKKNVNLLNKNKPLEAGFACTIKVIGSPIFTEPSTIFKLSSPLSESGWDALPPRRISKKMDLFIVEFFSSGFWLANNDSELSFGAIVVFPAGRIALKLYKGMVDHGSLWVFGNGWNGENKEDGELELEVVVVVVDKKSESVKIPLLSALISASKSF